MIKKLILLLCLLPLIQAGQFNYIDNFNYNGSNASLYANYGNISTTRIAINGLVRNMTILNDNSGFQSLLYLSLNMSNNTEKFSDQNVTFTLDTSYNLGVAVSMDFQHWGYFFKADSPILDLTMPNYQHNGLPTNGYFIGFRKGTVVAFDANFTIIRIINGTSTVLNHTPPYPQNSQLNITLNVSEGMIYVWNSTLANGQGTRFLMLSYNDGTTNSSHFGYAGFSYGWELLTFATYSNFTFSGNEQDAAAPPVPPTPKGFVSGNLIFSCDSPTQCAQSVGNVFVFIVDSDIVNGSDEGIMLLGGILVLAAGALAFTDFRGKRREEADDTNGV